MGGMECPLGLLQLSLHGSGIKGMEEGRGEGIRLVPSEGRQKCSTTMEYSCLKYTSHLNRRYRSRQADIENLFAYVSISYFYYCCDQEVDRNRVDQVDFGS